MLLQAAVGDHQVSNITAEVEARTIGAAVYDAGVDPGRHWDVDPFVGLPERIELPRTAAAALVYYDGGPVGFNGTRRSGHGDGAERQRPAQDRVGLRR